MVYNIRWGILATGRIASQFTNDLNLIEMPVTAVGSRSYEKAQAFAHEFRIPRAYGSYEELVEDPDVDAVYIATPNQTHAELAMLALRAGKHVLVEKPFALNAKQASEVIALSKETGLIAMEAMWTRWLPHMLRIRDLINRGALGEILSITADLGLALSTNPNHRVQSPEMGGGALLDLGIYPISFAWDLLGQPSRIMAMATKTETGVDALTSVILGFPGGQQATIQTTLQGRTPVRASINGTLGRIEIDSYWFIPNSFEFLDNDNKLIEKFETPVKGRGMQLQAIELNNLVTAGQLESKVMPSSQTIGVMETLDEIRRQIGLQYPNE